MKFHKMQDKPKTKRNAERNKVVTLAAQCLFTDNQCGLHVVIDDGNWNLAPDYLDELTGSPSTFIVKTRHGAGSQTFELSDADVNAARTILHYYVFADRDERLAFRKAFTRKWKKMHKELFQFGAFKVIPNMEYWKRFNMEDLKVLPETDPEAIYWHGHGKYQPYVAMLNAHMPDIGTPTRSRMFALFTDISTVYYDVYNNGGCNLDGPHQDRIDTIKKHIEFDYKKAIRDRVYLEAKMNEAVELIKAEPLRDVLNFPVYTVYQDFMNSTLSNYRKTKNFTSVTFAEREECHKWIGHRIQNWNWKWIPKPGGPR